MSNNCSVYNTQCIAKERHDAVFGGPCNCCKENLVQKLLKVFTSEVKAFSVSTSHDISLQLLYNQQSY